MTKSVCAIESLLPLVPTRKSNLVYSIVALNAVPIAASESSTCSAVCDVDRKQVSNWEGGTKTWDWSRDWKNLWYRSGFEVLADWESTTGLSVKKT